MASRVNPRLVGGFVLVAVALGVAAVLLFGSGRLFRTTVTLVSYFDGSVAGLNPGSAVRFRGVEVGEVKETRLNLPGERLMQEFAIPVIWELDVDRIRSRGGDLRRDFTSPAVLDSLIDAGLRARLGVESLLTGRLFLDLDVYPEREAEFVGGPDIPYPEVPTLPTEFKEIQEQVETILQVISSIDAEAFVEAVTGTVEGIERFVGSEDLETAIGGLSGTIEEVDETLERARSMFASIDTTVSPIRRRWESTTDSLSVTLRELRATLGSVRTVLEPGSPLTVELETALRDFSEAARSLRALADYLERNPSAILRGKPEDEDQ